MDIDDIVMSDPKTEPETLRERLDRIERSIDRTQLLALAAIAMAFLIASRLS